MIKILYVSGSRADYGPARNVLKLLNSDVRFELSVLVTGMHLDVVHGETWREIVEDGLTIAESITGHIEGDSVTEMAASLGAYLHGMSYAISRIRPDVLLVLGDRGEQLAGCIAGAFHNIVVVHLCGGSISGSIDDSIRHAITKFAHYHLPAFEEHANRILQMGESPDRVKIVGLPGNDISSDVTFSREEVCFQFHLPLDKPYILVLQHAVSHTFNIADSQIVETLDALSVLDDSVLLANPNDDAGGRVILSRMKEYASKYDHMQILPPVASRELFASIMCHSSVLVGNSSAGIVEAMNLGLPVVNIGDRQSGREYQSCMINVDYKSEDIYKAIQLALHDETYQQKLLDFTKCVKYIDTPTEVVNFIANIDLDVGQYQKPFVDFN